MLRRSLTSAGNNPSVQSFKFDLIRTNNNNNLHNNTSHRYDKSSITPTAMSSLQNYPTNTPDMTMDRSFSPISGIDIETVGESRKSSNIASAVVF